MLSYSEQIKEICMKEMGIMIKIYSLMFKFMSIFSRIIQYFTPKVIFVWKSVLSHPWISHLELDQSHINVLKIIYEWQKLKASAIDRVYNSWWRRANDLLHLGYVDNVGTKHMMIYQINDKWLSLINKLWKEKN